MVRLEYWNSKKWILCGQWHSEHNAWESLGGDDYNYRTVCCKTGEALTDKSTDSAKQQQEELIK